MLLVHSVQVPLVIIVLAKVTSAMLRVNNVKIAIKYLEIDRRPGGRCASAHSNNLFPGTPKLYLVLTYHNRQYMTVHGKILLCMIEPK